MCERLWDNLITFRAELDDKMTLQSSLAELWHEPSGGSGAVEVFLAKLAEISSGAADVDIREQQVILLCEAHHLSACHPIPCRPSFESGSRGCFKKLFLGKRHLTNNPCSWCFGPGAASHRALNTIRSS